MRIIGMIEILEDAVVIGYVSEIVSEANFAVGGDSDGLVRVNGN
jgi:hypothetical protein